VFIDDVCILLISVQNYTFLSKNVTICPIIFQKNVILLRIVIFFIGYTIKIASNAFI